MKFRKLFLAIVKSKRVEVGVQAQQREKDQQKKSIETVKMNGKSLTEKLKKKNSGTWSNTTITNLQTNHLMRRTKN